ncbi:hypothetical protein ACWGSH_09955 [Streptomyces diastaticus]
MPVLLPPQGRGPAPDITRSFREGKPNRLVNPKDLEQLAKLLDGRGGLSDKLDEAFTRASSLGVSGKLSSLRPMRTWVSDTGPELRKKAAYARLEDGDPLAGLLLAGFTPEQLKNKNLPPDLLLVANAAAANEGAGQRLAEEEERRDSRRLARARAG